MSVIILVDLCNNGRRARDLYISILVNGNGVLGSVDSSGSVEMAEQC